MKQHSKSLVCIFLLLLLYPRSSSAQVLPTEGGYSLQYWAFLLQGDDLRVSEDFVVRLDSRKLRVAIRDLGITRSRNSEDLSVTLLQPGGVPEQTQQVAGGEVVFENVKSGLSAIIVMGRDSSELAQTIAYSAFAFYAAESQQLGPDAGLDVLDIPLGTASSQVLLTDVGEMIEAKPANEFVPLSEVKVSSANRFRIERQPDRSLVGRVIVSQREFTDGLAETLVSITQDGKLVAQTSASANGKFTLPDLPLGFYTIYCNGPAGHASYAIELIDPDEEKLQTDVSFDEPPPQALKYVSLPAAAEEFGIMLIPPAILSQVRQVVQRRFQENALSAALTAGGGLAAAVGFGQGDENGNGNSMSLAAGGGGSSTGGAGGGGAGGGGAGGGGAGGRSGILGIAAIAVGVSALSTRDDGFSAGVATRIVPP